MSDRNFSLSVEMKNRKGSIMVVVFWLVVGVALAAIFAPGVLYVSGMWLLLLLLPIIGILIGDLFGREKKSPQSGPPCESSSDDEEKPAPTANSRRRDVEISEAPKPKPLMDCKYAPRDENEFEIRGIEKAGKTSAFFDQERMFMLTRDCDNAYDSNAIGVICDGVRVAYVAKDVASRLAPILDEGWTITVANILGTYNSSKWGCCYVRIVKRDRPSDITAYCPNCGVESLVARDSQNRHLQCGSCGCRFVLDGGKSKLLLACIRCGNDLLIDRLSDGETVWCSNCRYVHVFSSAPLPMLKPYPWFERSLDADAIRHFVTDREITKVVHFTSFPSLLGIFRTGMLMSRQAMDEYRREKGDGGVCELFHANDEERWDNRLGYINTSIQSINSKLLWSMQQRSENANREPWCVLEFDPVCLEKDGVLFTVSNAASKYVREHGTTLGMDGLSAMFASSIISGRQTVDHATETYTVTRQYEAPKNCPTDSQAEVLIPGTLSIQLLDGIVFKTSADRDYAMAKLRPEFPIINEIPFKVSAQEFNGNKDAQRKKVCSGF